VTKPDAALPIVVGANARRIPGDRGDQRVYGDDGTLVIHASSPIDGAVVSEHRPTVVVVDGARWKLLRHQKAGTKDIYTLSPWEPGPFEREGLVVAYDPDRVHHARVEQLSLALRTVLMFALLPVAPLLGSLPVAAKQWLRIRGLLPPASQASSLAVEWLLMYVLAGAGIASFLAGSFVLWIAFAAAVLVVGIDIPYRITRLAEARDVGMLAWPREFIRTLRERSPVDDDRPSLPPPSPPSPPA
jgi:hypothetical protein